MVIVSTAAFGQRCMSKGLKALRKIPKVTVTVPRTPISNSGKFSGSTILKIQGTQTAYRRKFNPGVAISRMDSLNKQSQRLRANTSSSIEQLSRQAGKASVRGAKTTTPKRKVMFPRKK